MENRSEQVERLARMRAELGPPAHDLHNGGPDYILTAVFGTRGFTPQTLGVLTFFYWFNRAYRSLAMPCQLEAFKMGERKGIASRWIAGAIVLATVVGVLSGSWALYQVGYRNGAEARMAGHYTYFGAEAFNRLQGWIQSPKGTDVPAVVAISGGFLLTLALQAARMRFSISLAFPPRRQHPRDRFSRHRPAPGVPVSGPALRERRAPGRRA